MNQQFNFDNWILYQDQDLLAINKPSGLLSVPGRKPEHKFCAIAQLETTHPTALITHRLDMDTSGIMLFALNKEAQRAISILFQDRKIDKTYQAICAGQLKTPTGSIDLPMRCDWENRPRQIVDFEQGKNALTHYQLVEQQVDRFRVNLFPITGRSHQLRVHMQQLGHPILGDSFYADSENLAKSNRLLLHASKLEFIHPTSNQPICIECQPDF